MALEPGTTVDVAERQLIVLAKSGQQEAFSALIRRYIQRVYRSAYAILRNPDDADDVAQETFVRAYRNISRFDETRPLFPWLHRIARNLSLNRIERVNKRETKLPDTDMVAERSPSPEQQAIHSEELKQIRRAVEQLPEFFREIIELSHFQECSYREIAEILSIPIGTVMSRLYNARKKLKSILEEGLSDE